MTPIFNFTISKIYWVIFITTFAWRCIIQASGNQVYFKLTGSRDVVENPNGLVLNQEVFQCKADASCSKVVKRKSSKKFELIYGEEDATNQTDYEYIWEKIVINLQEGSSWSSWKADPCSKKCGGGIQTLFRYCHSLAGGCAGESRMVRPCNQEGCPDVINCTKDNTSFDSSGGGSALYLERQNVSCNNRSTRILNGFQLENLSTDIRYNFTCCQLRDEVCKVSNNWTTWDDDGGGLIHYLDRHAVDCGNESFISQFQLERNIPTAKIRYAYSCCNLFDSRWKSSTSCYTEENPYTDDGSPTYIQMMYALSDQPVYCRFGYALSRFTLTRHPTIKREWRYIFKCCKVDF